jgi:hypothetical protein
VYDQTIAFKLSIYEDGAPAMSAMSPDGVDVKPETHSGVPVKKHFQDPARPLMQPALFVHSTVVVWTVATVAWKSSRDSEKINVGSNRYETRHE